jgi:CCR4-NOT transcriptional complex subunit CAF120
MWFGSLGRLARCIVLLKTMASIGLPTDEPPLHPGIHDIVSLVSARKQKVYFSGPAHYTQISSSTSLWERLGPRGDVWAQLSGTTLGIKEVRTGSQQGKEAIPMFVDIADSVRPPFHLRHLRDSTKPSSQPVTISKSDMRINISIPGSDMISKGVLSFLSTKDFASWVAAFRLSRWEKLRIDEIYTAHLIRTTVNNGRNTPSTLTDGILEGWVRINIYSGWQGWQRVWMCVAAGTVAKDVAPSSQYSTRSSSYTASRGKSNGPPRKARVFFYKDQRRGDDMRPVVELSGITAAFAVYPEWPEPIGTRALIKLRGDCCRGGTERSTYNDLILLSPDLEGSRIKGMLRWLIGERVPFAKSFWVYQPRCVTLAIHDVFELYGRPNTYSWDPKDPISMMSAYPTGPNEHVRPTATIRGRRLELARRLLAPLPGS